MRHAALTVMLALFLSACGGSKIVREPPAPLPDFTPQAQIQELWSAGVGATVAKLPLRLVPYFDGNAIYAADARGRVSAISTDGGRRLWETNLNATVTGATGVGDGLVVVGTQKGQVIALNKEDGKQAWSATVTSTVMSPPVVLAGVVVVQTVDGKLSGLALADGKRLWVYERSEPALSLLGTSAPVVVDEFVLSGFASGKIVALNIKDGRLMWEFTVSHPRGRNEIERMVDVDAPLLIVRDTLYAASYQGKIVAVDMRAGGRLLWTRDASTFTGMDAGRGNIYLSDAKGHVLALDQATGASVWKQDKLHGRSLSAPTYIDGYVVVGDYQGYLHWLSAEDGRFVARYRVGSDAVTARALPGAQTLYVLNQGGSLAALAVRSR
ncbi:MAG: outer membrane protein assembly factor BamB [Candidatus Muproteobacteria bacterium RBG_16_64_10]|uniref:Outer membrane protein assembly factor BamB n=1 Tax=Candidatus Muproteobacteria bacterium RBG_16_64_10 TaxID=1817757 RepID=A0A1F6T0S2_9PROT|nr:MAG: outer membrane protein assembly factor BamB [Candidatus Muproteobacteria bacterium RBG_16_64_10]